MTVTLLRDGQPVLTVVRQPVGDLTYTAVRGGGAHLNGRRLRTSAKTGLEAAIAATGQAEADQADTYRRIGQSITAMLDRALLVRASVPSTFPLLLVAAGQRRRVLAVRAGAARRRGRRAARHRGGRHRQPDRRLPWGPGSPDILAAAPGLHQAAARFWCAALTAVA